jgi:hypothetical protein
MRMELHELILCEAIVKEIVPALNIDAGSLVEMRCYQTIKRIHEIVSNDALDDAQCFARVEEIVTALDELGIGGGGRHDFG